MPTRERQIAGPMVPSESSSPWVASASLPVYPSFSGTASVDVVVVGAGITGITAAVLLKEAGKRVALLDALRVGQGVTGYTSAHLTEVPDCRYRTLLSHFGENGGRLAVRGMREAIDTVERFVRGRDIDCAFRRVPGYYYTERPENVPDVEEEGEAARRLGVDAITTRDVPLPFAVRAALRFEHQARFHVREYLRPLLESVPGNGSAVFEGARVIDVEDGTPCVVKTEQGEIRATDIVMATHVPLNRLLLQTKLAHYRSYVLACDVGRKVDDALYWDDEDPYHYTRVADIDGRRLLIVGGEDHKVGQEEDTDARVEALLAYAHARFDVREVVHRWSAQVAEPVDGMPYLGLNSGSSHVYVGTGYSGTGLTFGTLAATIASDLILGRDNDYAEVFDATRVKPVAGASRFVAENVDFPAHYVADRLKSAEGDSLDAVAPGEGKVIEIGGHKRAVYRSESGELRVLDPVCPHMGCLVGFNTAEKTWDCPCHGSRFGNDGGVIDGPAISGLKPV
jgi:glycine/D-amino acid oxidase-like deaminating enzyme/nitrite reductase/ring-hydroxylating ferredoxin subunit